jgi:hypothetical protein
MCVTGSYAMARWRRSSIQLRRASYSRRDDELHPKPERSQGENLEFSNSGTYWWSRLKATLWNAAYSTQWSIGPLSELTVEKYGTHSRW